MSLKLPCLLFLLSVPVLSATETQTESSASWLPQPHELVGYLTIMLASCFCQSVGLGGGAVIVPTFVIVFGLSPYHAVALSSLCIFAGLSAITFSSLKLRHPLQKGPLIQYDAALIIMPSMILGGKAGVLLNQVLPQWAIYTGMTVVFTTTLTKTFSKYQKQVEKETSPDLMQPLVRKPSHGDPFNRPRLPSEDYISYQHIPASKFLIVFMIQLAVILVTLLQGDKLVDSFMGIEPCSTAYFAFFSLYAFILIGFTYLIAQIVQASARQFLIFTLTGFATGTLSGTFGIGGGIVLSLLFLEFNMVPQAISATLAFIIMSTAFSITLLYIIANQILMHYAVTLYVLVSFSAVVGFKTVRTRVQASGKESIIILIIALVMAAGVVTSGFKMTEELITDLSDGVLSGFREMCW